MLLQLDLKKGSSHYLHDVPLVMDIARNDEQRSVIGHGGSGLYLSGPRAFAVAPFAETKWLNNPRRADAPLRKVMNSRRFIKFSAAEIQERSGVQADKATN